MIPADARTRVRSLLDLGAGPGTATWAAATVCPDVASATLVDRSAALLDLGMRLARTAGFDRTLGLTTRVADVAVGSAWPRADLVVVAYALAELSESGRRSLVGAAWEAATTLLVLVEPGTPEGFARLHDARASLLARGAHLLAPCPHEQACPMRPGLGRDWCHFAVRLPRTRRHRQLKSGVLGYEDEKFACLVVSRTPVDGRAASRIVRHPRIDTGRVTLELCAPDGLARQTITRRDSRYRAARKADWGDAWSMAPDSAS